MKEIIQNFLEEVRKKNIENYKIMGKNVMGGQEGAVILLKELSQIINSTILLENEIENYVIKMQCINQKKVNLFTCYRCGIEKDIKEKYDGGGHCDDCMSPEDLPF